MTGTGGGLATNVLEGPTRPIPDGATLADLIEARVAEDPGAVAVIGGDERVTYADLDARANRLARHLQARGVGPDVPVAVLAGRSVGLTTALLAVLKAGGACVPVDPSYPDHRIGLMLRDAAPPVVVTFERLAARLPVDDRHVVCLDADSATIEAHPSDRPDRAAGPEHLAYVIYTSGSTGEPKGVMLPHRGLVNHAGTVSALYGLQPADRVLQFCSIGFDVSIEEIFPTWASGGTVVLRPDDDVPILGREWLAWLRRNGITVLNLPTAYWHEWVRDLRALGEEVPESVRLVVAGGEKALGSVYRTWLEVGGDRVRWLNAYGPAETSVIATVYEPSRDREWPLDRDPPIGRPVANTVVRILDQRGEPVAPGMAGDLHIGGAGLARGYLNRADLTAERFVPDRERPGEMLYRTGDLVRALEDGNLEFIGRMDEQVKIRGFRIELEEVESVLGRHPEVAEAVVVAREEHAGDRRLVGYVVPPPGALPSPGDLRRFVSDRLPPYMVPGLFVRLDALPLTPNGKVDREGLPAPGDPRVDVATPGAAPRTEVERTIADIWSRIVGVEAIGLHDDFFDLGGHSLQATQVIAEIRETFDVEIPVRALFEGPTVAALSARVEELRGRHEGIPPLEPLPRRPGDRIPLTLSQEQMWRLETTADPPGLYNITGQHWFADPPNEEALRRALALVADRHEALRASFHAGPDGPYQVIAASLPVDLAVSDLRNVPPERVEAEMRRLVAEQDAQPFDFARPPLFRSRLYRLPGGRSMVAVTVDHLVCDGNSAYILLSELTAAYEALVADEKPTLRPLPVQYPDFALWQRRWATEERLQAQVEYWKRRLAGMPLGPAVPFDRVPETATRRITARSASLTGEAYEGMRRLARATGSTMFVVIVAAVQALFSRVGGRTDMVFSTTLNGRQWAEVEALIGCFHGVGRLRTDLSGDPTFAEVVARTRETALGLFENQDVPFMRVRQAILPDFPSGGIDLLTAVPTELGYFHTTHDEWAPGAGVVERPGAERSPDELFFRGHLHPLVVSCLDDGTQVWCELSYKIDFYDDETIEGLTAGLDRVVAAVIRDPAVRISELPVGPSGRR